MRGAAAQTRRGDPPRKIGQQQAAGQLQRNLHPCGRSVVLHAEEPEAERQKERVAGQPDQRRLQRSAGRDERIAAVQQQVFGHSP